MTDRQVSRAEIARRLNLSEKRITQLVKEGRLKDGTAFPSRVDGRSRTFPSDRCFEWYVRFKQEEALQRAAPAEPDNLRTAELRQAIADASIAELKLAGLRNEVAPVEEHRRELRRILGRVRSRIIAIPGTYASQLLGVPTMADAAVRLRVIVVAILSDLQQAAGALETDDEGEVEEEESSQHQAQ